MRLWVAAIVAYFAFGLIFVFVGPAARQRRAERQKLEWQAYDQPKWKLKVFSALIAAGIGLLWPFLVVSAARKETNSKIDLIDLPDVAPSDELDHWISEVRKLYSDSLPFESYSEIVKKLPWNDRMHFDSYLAKQGYLITGFATGPKGQDFSVATSVLHIGMPISLTRMRGKAGSLPPTRKLAENEISIDPLSHDLSFQVPTQPDDEVWEFSSSKDSWNNLAGRAGVALVRKGAVIEINVTIMN